MGCRGARSRDRRGHHGVRVQHRLVRGPERGEGRRLTHTGQGRWISADAGDGAAYLRAEVELAAAPTRATARFVGLGYGELYLNGQRAGDAVLEPAFTNYSKRILWSSHDVTDALTAGPNALAVILGHGFYDLRTPDHFGLETASWRTPQRMLLDLELEFEHGPSIVIGSDASWHWRTGPITFACIRGGESIDTRIDLGEWMHAAFDDADWTPVDVVEPTAAVLERQLVPPMRVTGSLEPVAITEPTPGTWLVDFGRHLTGWAEVELHGERGSVVSIDHNEVLRDDGTLDLEHSAGHTDGRFQHGELVLSGGERDRYAPRFTYHGFRYVQLNAKPDRIVARCVHTDLRAIGRFECSDPRLNELHAAAVRTMLNSAHGMPAEEPTREKMGWSQDAQNLFGAYALNFDAHALYLTYLQDLIDVQEDSGHIPPIAPTDRWGRLDDDGRPITYDDPWWGATLAVLAARLYDWYGDRSAIELAAEPARRYLAWLGTTAVDGVLTWSLGDWLELNQWGERLTSVEVTSTMAWFELARLQARFDDILAVNSEAAALAAELRARINARWLDADGWYQRGSQTAQALALDLGLPPADRVEQVRANLAGDVLERGGHLTTGFLGVMPALHQLPLQLAFEAVTQPTGSGWFHMLDGGGTLGENIHPEGYGTNHHPFGACVDTWLYTHLAGIRAVAPDRFTIEPGIVDGLDWARAEHTTEHGRVAVSWSRNDAGVELTVDLPAETTATVRFAGEHPVGPGTHRWSA